jgi:hypothetical protein
LDEFKARVINAGIHGVNSNYIYPHADRATKTVKLEIVLDSREKIDLVKSRLSEIEGIHNQIVSEIKDEDLAKERLCLEEQWKSNKLNSYLEEEFVRQDSRGGIFDAIFDRVFR